MFDPCKKKIEKIGEFLGFGIALGIFFSLLFYMLSKFTGIGQIINYKVYISSVLFLYSLNLVLRGLPKKHEKREPIC